MNNEQDEKPETEPTGDDGVVSTESSVREDGGRGNAEMVGELLPLVRDLRPSIEGGVAAVLSAFEEKLARDRHKEALIDKLHAELQEYRRNLVMQAVRPIKTGLIRLHDDLGRTLEHYQQQGVQELTPERALELLTNFQAQVEIALEEGGVNTFREAGERFEPRRQKALRTIPTDEQSLVGTVAARLRPGFEEGPFVHEKERVAVYVIAPPAAEMNTAKEEAK